MQVEQLLFQTLFLSQVAMDHLNLLLGVCYLCRLESLEVPNVLRLEVFERCLVHRVETVAQSSKLVVARHSQRLGVLSISLIASGAETS